jgi:hypothetical protein
MSGSFANQVAHIRYFANIVDVKSLLILTWCSAYRATTQVYDWTKPAQAKDVFGDISLQMRGWNLLACANPDRDQLSSCD